MTPRNGLHTRMTSFIASSSIISTEILLYFSPWSVAAKIFPVTWCFSCTVSCSCPLTLSRMRRGQWEVNQYYSLRSTLVSVAQKNTVAMEPMKSLKTRTWNHVVLYTRLKGQCRWWGSQTAGRSNGLSSPPTTPHYTYLSLPVTYPDATFFFTKLCHWPVLRMRKVDAVVGYQVLTSAESYINTFWQIKFLHLSPNPKP